ncbi:KH domain-containing protein [Meiothermus sp. QL-1]|uniref:KH domain-containing protein n=1 Tax=Meiothermus sp. QL-1 TaxID=2058095 RepID=UPI000E0C730A|nr:KH domain-containing protein [Meiothermus sp. QL-1]RDI95960.1 KH domain-containing protein [Meiothermus sp. QL-1]
MRDLVEYLAKAVVDHPGAVRVDERRGREGWVYYIETHPEDKGRLIGRQGRVIEAIRTVVRSFGKGRVNVEVR